MEEIKSFAVTVCAVSILSAIAGGIFSEERYGKLIRLVVSGVLVCVLLAQIPSIGDCSYGQGRYTANVNNERLNEEISEQTADMAADIISRTVASELAKYGYSVESVETVVDISDDGCITIDRVDIAADANEERIRSITAGLLALDEERITVN
ncbi:MAG: hypothetical protein IJP10_03730 [Clostridia bacterium]|nr:hypothetical protein [Oscillospiraceae bacterium]MBQ6797105.1 hypothetical protein [Clostridia bacterium]